MKNPLFSIIIPVYNVEKYLEQCLNSVLHQNFEDYEVIVVNDGSTDNSSVICDTYVQIDTRIKVIHKDNGGLSDARNFGVKAAIGSYVIFLDSDDYWQDLYFLTAIAEVVTTKPEVMIVNFGWTKYFASTNQFVKDQRVFSVPHIADHSKYITSLLQKDLYVASAWNKCVKRVFLVENNLFFRKGLRSEDMAWCGDLLYLMPEMACLHNYSYIYRQERLNSITATVDHKHLYDIIKMIKVALQNSEKLPPNEKLIYLSFFAVQYLTLLFNLKTSRKEDPALFNDIYRLKIILENDLNFKVKLANKVSMFFGFKSLVKVLHLYGAHIRK